MELDLGGLGCLDEDDDVEGPLIRISTVFLVFRVISSFVVGYCIWFGLWMRWEADRGLELVNNPLV
jgi:hypothetical protein